MTRAVRHFFAVLLLVLLPLQAFAAGYAAGEAPVVPCPAEMMDAGCCDGDGINSAGCGASSCLALAAPALPAAAVPDLPGAIRVAAAPVVPRLHPSHVPDGPRRPPRALP
jgi:hypothetical protein